MQISAGWDAGMAYPRALLRLVGTGLMAWGLLRRNVWAWRIAVAATAFWAFAGALSVLLLAESGSTDRLPLPGWWFGFVAASVLLLFAALAALLAPSTRAEFRGGAG
ncbi:MAG TPA: hypothetical protein VF665_24270 [Longimicrobium sp.]|uniref:hypothetical protein n=1 Tax=Longimicrobium sp. TaxID=2029185 RepID=UPI002ED7CB05